MFLSKKKWLEARIVDNERHLNNFVEVVYEIRYFKTEMARMIDIIVSAIGEEKIDIFIDRGSDIVSSTSRQAIEVQGDRNAYLIKTDYTTDREFKKTLLDDKNAIGVRGKSNSLERAIEIVEIDNDYLIIYTK